MNEGARAVWELSFSSVSLGILAVCRAMRASGAASTAEAMIARSKYRFREHLIVKNPDTAVAFFVRVRKLWRGLLQE